jgi:hypothetical protein
LKDERGAFSRSNLDFLFLGAPRQRRNDMKALWTVLAMLAIGTQANFGFAEESKDKKGDKKGDATVIESKISEHQKSPCLGACQVNFRKELGLTFDYLDGLGLRIHEAAEGPDPVDLAAAAKSLAIAEGVAGKKAKVTSDQILKEAIKLAKLRQDPQELKAVAMLVDDEKIKADLGKAGDSAAQKDTGERSRAIFRSLIVTNHAGECLNIYVDGRYVGQVHEGDTSRLHVHSHANPNHLTAYCMEGGEVVDHAHFWGSAPDVSWHIGH